MENCKVGDSVRFIDRLVEIFTETKTYFFIDFIFDCYNVDSNTIRIYLALRDYDMDFLKTLENEIVDNRSIRKITVYNNDRLTEVDITYGENENHGAFLYKVKPPNGKYKLSIAFYVLKNQVCLG